MDSRVPGLPDVVPGTCYVVRESGRRFTYEFFKRLYSARMVGLVVTRKVPARLRKELGLPDVEVLWLRAPAELHSLERTIRGFIASRGPAALLLDGVEFLSANNGFPRTLTFVQHLVEFILQTRSIGIVPASPGTLEEEELLQLERISVPLGLRDHVVVLPQNLIVRLLPKTPTAVAGCDEIRDLLLLSTLVTADIDLSVRRLEEKVRQAQRERIPFIVIVPGGRNPSPVVDVIMWTGREESMSLSTLSDHVARWRRSAR